MVVEDDDKLAAILSEELRRFGYDVVRAIDPARVKEEFVACRPDWCSGHQLASFRRVLLVPAAADHLQGADHLHLRPSDDMDQVRALENGGDDYITKPFNLELAIAKIKAHPPDVRRVCPRREAGRDWAGELLAAIEATTAVSYRDKEVELAPKEFRLLCCSWSATDRSSRVIFAGGALGRRRLRRRQHVDGQRGPRAAPLGGAGA